MFSMFSSIFNLFFYESEVVFLHYLCMVNFIQFQLGVLTGEETLVCVSKGVIRKKSKKPLLRPDKIQKLEAKGPG